jgi:hypothetical protein
MARVIKQGKPVIEVAVIKHDCGATVEFEKSDIRNDQREGNYVICPACKVTPWIDAGILKWKKQK